MVSTLLELTNVFAFNRLNFHFRIFYFRYLVCLNGGGRVSSRSGRRGTLRYRRDLVTSLIMSYVRLRGDGLIKDRNGRVGTYVQTTTTMTTMYTRACVHVSVPTYERTYIFMDTPVSVVDRDYIYVGGRDTLCSIYLRWLRFSLSQLQLFAIFPREERGTRGEARCAVRLMGSHLRSANFVRSPFAQFV